MQGLSGIRQRGLHAFSPSLAWQTIQKNGNSHTQRDQPPGRRQGFMPYGNMPITTTCCDDDSRSIRMDRPHDMQTRHMNTVNTPSPRNTGLLHGTNLRPERIKARLIMQHGLHRACPSGQTTPAPSRRDRQGKSGTALQKLAAGAHLSASFPSDDDTETLPAPPTVRKHEIFMTSP